MAPSQFFRRCSKRKIKETDSSNKDNFRIKNGPKRQIDIKVMDFLYKHYYVN